jgi:hypothetical protein
MTVEERIATFLLQNKGKAYCDDCLAKELASTATKPGTPRRVWGRQGQSFRETTVLAARHDTIAIRR